MKIKRFISNKYTLILFIVIAYLTIDVLLHKGMTRVLLPTSFSKSSADILPSCNSNLLVTSKNWKKGINTIEKIKKLPQNVAGLEIDVYFDTSRRYFEAYHDSSSPERVHLDSIIDFYFQKELTASIWLDFKNLNRSNQQFALTKVVQLQHKYELKNKLIIESSMIESLQLFCQQGFFTSYYVPFFNPYTISNTTLTTHIQTIQNNIALYPTSALSGYYFQYPLLKQYFPKYPILTWTDDDATSVISQSFIYKLKKDDNVLIFLTPP